MRSHCPVKVVKLPSRAAAPRALTWGSGLGRRRAAAAACCGFAGVAFGRRPAGCSRPAAATSLRLIPVAALRSTTWCTFAAPGPSLHLYDAARGQHTAVAVAGVAGRDELPQVGALVAVHFEMRRQPGGCEDCRCIARHVYRNTCGPGTAAAAGHHQISRHLTAIRLWWSSAAQSAITPPPPPPTAHHLHKQLGQTAFSSRGKM